MGVEVALAIALLVLLGNAFFVGAEFAVVSARRTNIELKALEGSRSAKITLKAMEQVSLMLAGAQLGITLCSLIFGAVGEPVIAHALEGPLANLGVSSSLLHPISFAIALILMVYLHVVIGEMVPKNISLARATRAALLLAPILYFIVLICKPVINALNAFANFCLRLIGITPQQEVRSSFNRDEVAGFVKESSRNGLISQEEETLLSGSLNFEEKTVQDIMRPIDSVATAPHNPYPSDIEKLSVDTGFSRFPIEKEPGNISGYVHVKDLLRVRQDQLEKPLAKSLIRPLAAVAADTTLRGALLIMQEKSSHIAKVTDDQRRTVGIVILEDILEELIGPISHKPSNA